MTNKQAYKEVAAQVISLLAQADTLLTNASHKFDSEATSSIEHEYYVQKFMLQGAVRSALHANSETEYLVDKDGMETGEVAIKPIEID